MTEKNKEPNTQLDSHNSMLAYLAEWKTQLSALLAAPFIGLGFVFDFLLRAKDFPELASAVWGLFGFFVGMFFFILSLLIAGFLAAGQGKSERGVALTGWRRGLAIWFPRGVVFLGILILLLTGYSLLMLSANGFGIWTTPYVDWLKLHSGH